MNSPLKVQLPSFLLPSFQEANDTNDIHRSLSLFGIWFGITIWEATDTTNCSPRSNVTGLLLDIYARFSSTGTVNYSLADFITPRGSKSSSLERSVIAL